MKVNPEETMKAREAKEKAYAENVERAREWDEAKAKK